MLDRVSTTSLQPFRLGFGGLIDRAQTRQFSFDGRLYSGHPGDTLASALLANGVRLVGRSFKYHRPRGFLSAGIEEPNGLAELHRGARREPNSPMTMVELHDGLEAHSQNRWPSLGFDVMSVNSLLAPILAAGFYYKTFMWPASFWERVYEPLIRRAAGLGRLSGKADPDHYEKATAFCDVLVVGSGPAGLMAARTAAQAGARVILCEADFELGGRLLADARTIDERPGAGWAASMEASLAGFPELRVMRRTTVFGAYDDGVYAALERVSDHMEQPRLHQPRQRLWRIEARRVVLAAGAIERPLVFGGNDLPGVMLAGAVRCYLNRHAVATGSRAVLFANNDDAARTAIQLAAAGVEVAALVDPRPEPSDLMRHAAQQSGAPLLSGSVVSRAVGGDRLRYVRIVAADGRRSRVSCDLLAMSGGWTPTLHLASQAGTNPVHDASIGSFIPGTPPAGMGIAGAASGRLTLADALADGQREGASAAEACGFSTAVGATAMRLETESVSQRPFPQGSHRGRAFVDFGNDVTVKDVELAEREGFRSVEQLKRYTTLGMAPDQGKTANVNGLALMAGLTGRSIAETGTTRYRPPFTPVTIGALGGSHRGKDFRPTRRTPTHDWASEQGAVFTEAGAWLRAQYYPKPGEDWLAAATREALAVREAVGFCDVTTLGKIELDGPDAARFLDRVYANTVSTLKPGRARYGLMLREDGFVLDDGTVARLSDQRFVLTTTTANAARVMGHLEFCAQVLWPQDAVQLASVTEQWAQVAIAGPASRNLLAGLVEPGFDLSNDAFPHMSAAEVTLRGGLRARLFRMSYSGELAYELAVPARFGDALVRHLSAAGGVPYGTEALAILRVEKGHVAGGELDGTVTAHDLGLGRMLSTKKDFIGRAMASRPALTDPGRKRLVGVRPVDRTARLRAGTHLLEPDGAATAAQDRGYLTSCVWSPSLGMWIGLALLADGPARIGTRMRAYDPVRAGDTPVEITEAVAVDPEGARLHG